MRQGPKEFYSSWGLEKPVTSCPQTFGQLPDHTSTLDF